MSQGSEKPRRPLSGLFRHSAIYGLVPAMQKVITLAIMPLVFKWLPAEQFGASLVTDLFLIALAEILGMNFLSGMVRFYFDHKEPSKRKAVISSSILVTSGIAWVFCGAMLFFVDELRPILLGRDTENVSEGVLGKLLMVALLTVPFQLCTQSGFRYLQILKRSGTYSAIQISKMFLELSLKIWFVSPLMNLGPLGLILPVLIGEALTTLLVTGWTLRQVGFRVQWTVLKPIVLYTLPLIPVGLCQLGVHKLDLRLLEAFSPKATAFTLVGIYGVAYQVGYLVNALMLGPFLQIWQPWIYDVENERERGELVARISSYAILAIATASLFLILFNREAIVIFTPKGSELRDGYLAVPWVAAAYVLWALYKVTEIPFFIAKRTGPILGINFAALALNIGFNWILIPRYGFVGAGMATFSTMLSLAVMGMLMSRTVLIVHFELGRILMTLGTVCVSGLIVVPLDMYVATPAEIPLGPILAIKSSILFGMLWVHWRVILKADERRLLLNWLLKRMAPLQQEPNEPK